MALRFLFEMGVPKNYSVVKRGLEALAKDDWISNDQFLKKSNSWINTYKPEIGMFGIDHLRAVFFAYFSIEDHEFIRIEIKRALGYINKVLEISSIDDITGIYKKKLYYKIPLPDFHNFELLAYTKSWRNKKSIISIAKALEHLIQLSPPPLIYIKSGSTLYAPYTAVPTELFKTSLYDFKPESWVWFRFMETISRLGVVEKIPVLKKTGL